MARLSAKILASAALVAMMASGPASAQSARTHTGVAAGDMTTAVPRYDGAFEGGTGGAGDNLGNHVATMRLDMNGQRIIRIADPDLSSSGGYDATNRRYVDAKAAAEAQSARDNLGNHIATQNLNLNSRKIVNLATPTAAGDATTKAYVDSAAAAARDNLGNHTATANLDMASRRIVNVANPSGGNDAANKTYVDNAANAARDNLGNHRATQILDMANFAINNVPLPTANLHAANKQYVDQVGATAAVNGRDNLGNHNATQRLNMASNKIVNLATPTAAADGATKAYVDATASSAASGARDNLGNHSATQNLNMSSNRIINVATPTSGADAATKAYVDSRVPTGLVPEGRAINTGAGLQGGGNLTVNRTISLADNQLRRSAGSSDVGVLAYAGHSRTGGQFYGGTENPNGSARMNYQGYLHATRFYGQMYLYFSDRTLKENIMTIGHADGIEIVRALRPVSYSWKESGLDAMGVIAQEIEEVMPMAVSTGEDGLKSVDYVQMIAPLLAAVQQLDERVSALEAAR